MAYGIVVLCKGKKATLAVCVQANVQLMEAAEQRATGVYRRQVTLARMWLHVLLTSRLNPDCKGKS